VGWLDRVCGGLTSGVKRAVGGIFSLVKHPPAGASVRLPTSRLLQAPPP